MSNKTGAGKILAIESAIRGGSICLLDGVTVLGEAHGSGDVSRAEDLLANIAELCESSGVEKYEIDVIAVSRGPGSYTGIRIGIATAVGLARALGCECRGVELLMSMAGTSGSKGRIIAALPSGRHDVSHQEFISDTTGVSPLRAPIVEPFDSFVDRVADFAKFQFVIEKELHPAIQENRPDSIVVENLAESIGIYARNGFGSADLTPIYLRNPAATGHF